MFTFSRLTSIAYLLASAAVALAQTGPADTVWVGGTVVTMVREADTAEAVAVRGGRIVAVGGKADLQRHVGPQTKTIDLAGRTLLPGFYAAHDHLPGSGRVALYDVDLNSPPIGRIETMDQLVAALKDRASQTPAGQW